MGFRRVYVLTREADSGGRVAGVAGNVAAGALEGRIDRPAMVAQIIRVRRRRALAINGNHDQGQSRDTITKRNLHQGHYAACRVHSSNTNANQYIKMVHTPFVGHTHSDT